MPKKRKKRKKLRKGKPKNKIDIDEHTIYHLKEIMDRALLHALDAAEIFDKILKPTTKKKQTKQTKRKKND